MTSSSGVRSISRRIASTAPAFRAQLRRPVVRLMLLLKIQSLSYGNSGVQLATVQRLVDFFNADILPVVSAALYAPLGLLAENQRGFLAKYGAYVLYCEPFGRYVVCHDNAFSINESSANGASGDLAPLANLSLPILGLGEVEYGGKVRPAASPRDRTALYARRKHRATSPQSRRPVRQDAAPEAGTTRRRNS